MRGEVRTYFGQWKTQGHGLLVWLMSSLIHLLQLQSMCFMFVLWLHLVCALQLVVCVLIDVLWLHIMADCLIDDFYPCFIFVYFHPPYCLLLYIVSLSCIFYTHAISWLLHSMWSRFFRCLKKTIDRQKNFSRNGREDRFCHLWWLDCISHGFSDSALANDPYSSVHSHVVHLQMRKDHQSKDLSSLQSKIRFIWCSYLDHLLWTVWIWLKIFMHCHINQL